MTGFALDERTAAAILAEVDRGFDRQLAFTRALVRHPSLRGREQTAQEAVHAALSERGYTVDRWRIDVEEIRGHPGFSPVDVSYETAINVVATHAPGTTRGRSLILNGHVDVVPPGPLDMWTRSPWEAQIEGDWLYGRGAGDMKAGLVANICALDAIRRAGFEPAATVYLQSVTEEECTGNGALAALVRGYRADAALIPEPSGHALVRGNVGVLWFRVRVRGHPVHVREAGAGANAIEAGFGVVQALRALEAELNAEKDRHPGWEGVDHPINLNIGRIAGGDWASSVPAWCDMDFRLAVYPDDDPARVARLVEDRVSAAARDHPYLSNNPPEVTWNGFFARGYRLEEGSEAEAVLADAHRAVHDAELAAEMATAYLDARVFMLYDDCPALVYGPRAENIHGFDERVSLASVRAVARTIALFTARWCGLNRL